MEIASPTNQYVKDCAKLLQKKYRSQSGKFLIEGYKTIKEAYDYGIKIERIFVDKDYLSKYEFAQDLIIETNSTVIKKISSTESPPEAVAIGQQKKYSSELFKTLNKVILLENIKDSGNLGTIIRSAVAFGCDGIVLYGDCTDLYNPKCVRSSVGNLWKLPIIEIDSFDILNSIFANYSRIATLPRSTNFLKTFKLNTPALLMFGSEADGLSEELINYSTDSLKIEMNKNVESLNLASSATIIMYELFV